MKWVSKVYEKVFFFDSFIFILLHAARRAMAAAVPRPFRAAMEFFNTLPFPTLNQLARL